MSLFLLMRPITAMWISLMVDRRVFGLVNLLFSTVGVFLSNTCDPFDAKGFSFTGGDPFAVYWLNRVMIQQRSRGV